MGGDYLFLGLAILIAVMYFYNKSKVNRNKKK
ncbi:hypothetical protein KCTC32516_00521 [Polaribacter huanghezhanensis]|nr:hypothetical protein KCTC32516_00521 [Polaribacter huanghezhanensis]